MVDFETLSAQSTSNNPSQNRDISGDTLIKVVGVGGCGCNTINHLMERGSSNVELVAVNTDAQALAVNKAPHKIQIGAMLTKGLGSGCDPNKGRMAAEESAEELKQALRGARLVFVTCGMGNGTGTGAAPVIADIARENGALVLGVMTRPFSFEGKNKTINADLGIGEFAKRANGVIVIDNNKILDQSPNLSLKQAFEQIDDVLYDSVAGLCRLILSVSYMNVDFADIETILRYHGRALIGVGRGEGPNFVEDAVKQAIHNPLLETVDTSSASGLIAQVCVNTSFPIARFEEINDRIAAYASKDATTKFTIIFDDALKDGEVEITVALSGISSTDNQEPEEQRRGFRAHQQASAAPQIQPPAQTPAQAIARTVPKKEGDDMWEVPSIFRRGSK